MTAHPEHSSGVPEVGTVRHARAVYAMFSERFAHWPAAELRDVIDGRRADDVLDTLYPLPDEERCEHPERKSEVRDYIINGCPRCDGWHRGEPCPMAEHDDDAPDFADSCCGKCPGDTCYVDQVLGN